MQCTDLGCNELLLFRADFMTCPVNQVVNNCKCILDG